MAEEEDLLEQLKGLKLEKLKRILLDLGVELACDVGPEEELPQEREDLYKAIEEAVEERPQVKQLRRREAELRERRELEARKAAAEREAKAAAERKRQEEERQRRLEEERLKAQRQLEEERLERERREAEKAEQERIERERREEEARRARQEQEERERREAQERARRAQPLWRVRRAAYLRALPQRQREAHLSDLSVRQLTQLLEEYFVMPAVVPVERRDFVAVLAESSKERSEREERLAAERREKEAREAEERQRREAEALRARREAEERARLEAEAAARRKAEERARWEALATAGRAEREAHLEQRSFEELKEMFQEAGLGRTGAPQLLEKYDLVVALGEPVAEREDRERAEAKARREAEERERSLAEELRLWASSHVWRCRRLAYLRALPLGVRESHFEVRSLEELSQLASQAGLAPSVPTTAATTSVDAERRGLLDALLEPAAVRLERVELAMERERKRQREQEERERQWRREREEQERQAAQPAADSAAADHERAQREAYLKSRSVKELKQMLSESGIRPTVALVEKQDFVVLLLAATPNTSGGQGAAPATSSGPATASSPDGNPTEGAASAGSTGPADPAATGAAGAAGAAAATGAATAGTATTSGATAGGATAGGATAGSATAGAAAAGMTTGDAAAVSPLDVADRVRITGLKAQELNGQFGTLVRMTDDSARWLVRLDGHREDKSIKPVNLELPSEPLKLPAHHSLCLAGSSDKWQHHEMHWDEDLRCYHLRMELGHAGHELFHILVDGRVDVCLHPDVANACPYFDYKLVGPSTNEHRKHWAVGRHPLDRGALGAAYQVRLFLTPDGRAKSLDWVRLAAGDDAKSALPRWCAAATRPDTAAPVRLPSYSSVSIVGSWSDFVMQKMTWNSLLQCFSHRLAWVGREGCEFFQIVLDSSWQKTLHPDKADACPEIPHRICGPDNRGHGLDWAIRPGAKGEYYEVRLFLSNDGGAESVSWTQITEEDFKSASKPRASAVSGRHVPRRLPKYDRAFIVGSWTDWKDLQEMSWNRESNAYHFCVTLGTKGQESFQIVLDRDWQLCLYPSEANANPHEDYELCGPDGDNHGKNWTIGKHRLDAGGKGKIYDVRFFLTSDGSAEKVDWLRMQV